MPINISNTFYTNYYLLDFKIESKKDTLVLILNYRKT